VPRGEIAFHDDFIRDVRVLMARGSMTIADAVESLAARAANAEEIARNLIFLVAAGVLIPFARPHVVDDSRQTPQYRATPMLERACAYAIDRGKGCSVPSEIMGNGFPLEPADARAIRGALSRRERPDDHTRELMATLARLGLVT